MTSDTSLSTPISRITTIKYRSDLTKWEYFIKMRAAYLLSPSFITRGRMGASKAALILMKNSHFDRTLQYLQSLLFFTERSSRLILKMAQSPEIRIKISMFLGHHKYILNYFYLLMLSQEGDSVAQAQQPCHCSFGLVFLSIENKRKTLSWFWGILNAHSAKCSLAVWDPALNQIKNWQGWEAIFFLALPREMLTLMGGQ